ncbi:hypothetical protein Q3G72_018701 [Acer saccharum]|nr:hypothetical protein Q3G72_018701 [Acer saccharum]
MSVMSGDKVIGSKTYFVFYSARFIHNWTMHEYRVDPGFMMQAESTDETLKIKIDTFVICYVCKEDYENWSIDETTSDQNEETMDDVAAPSQSDQSKSSKSDNQS